MRQHPNVELEVTLCKLKAVGSNTTVLRGSEMPSALKIIKMIIIVWIKAKNNVE